MKVFTFQPYQLSMGQHAAQAFHVGIELMLKYPKDKMVQHWAKKDKTAIIKVGGTLVDIETKIFKFFNSNHNPFPFVEFREPDMFNHITSVAICLPKHIYEDRVASNKFEEELISLLKRTQLAK